MTLLKKLSLRATLAAAAATVTLGMAQAQTIQFWTTEEPDRLAKQEAMAADFTAASGIAVEVIRFLNRDGQPRNGGLRVRRTA